MSTIGYQLNILRDTQMVQRRLLEKQFPYIDWEKMPFSSYGDFFRLRSIMEECGEVWTNAYGRSNEEADSTRKYLKDYSGKGRDIELFNFGWSRQSGFNGYVQDFRNWNVDVNSAVSYKISENSVNITNGQGSGATWTVGCYKNSYVNKEWRCYVKKSQDATITAIDTETLTNIKIVHLTEGLNTIPAFTEEEYSAASIIYITVSSEGGTLLLTQIPSYRGAIVGDGVDDYGQCVSGFALPSDYTVVAMREHIGTIMGCTLGRFKGTIQGAFIFENQLSNTHSFGSMTYPLVFPKLFSYQARSSFNGSDINAGNNQDDETYDLLLFKQSAQAKYNNTALYSFGIFSRTLTADELRTVENCMYAEWICMTGKLEGIEYYDILDARFRSNEESEDKRDKWVGRLGKLHMTLHNYGYSQMSGWNGWPFSSFSDFGYESLSDATENKAKITKLNSTGWICYMGIGASKTNEWRLRVHNPFGKTLYLIYINDNSSVKLVTLNEGINVIPPATEEFTNIAFEMNDFSIGEYIEVEQLPLYGGALVSDGVDDYAVSDEVIDEEIGGFVWHGEHLTAGYAFATYWGGNHVFMYKDNNGSTHYGGGTALEVETKIDKPVQILGFSKAPAIPNYTLKITPKLDSTFDYSNAALYQLRLIKSQPTDIQLEAIKWQCRKEHDDYLIHMGWKEVE